MTPARLNRLPFRWKVKPSRAWASPHVRLTPSSYPRLARCLGGGVLPNAVETLPGMSRGTAIHAFLEAIANGATQAEALAKVPAEWREDCESIPLAKLPNLTAGTAELAMAWSPSTGACRLLGTGLSREEAAVLARGDEVPMLADWAARMGETHGVLLDYKTGWMEGFAPAAEHLQLLTYGAVYLLATGLESVELYLCRPDRNRPHWDGPVVLDRLDAESHLARVVALMDEVHAARTAYTERRVLPLLNVGPWCAWCPAQRWCPAQVGALLAVLDGDAEREVRNVVELTPAQAGNLWQTLKAAEKLAMRLRKDVESFAARGALPLPDGAQLAAVPTVEQEPIPEAVEKLLRLRFGEEVALAVVKPDVSWTRLDEVLKSMVLPARKADHDAGRWQGSKPTFAALKREVRQALEAVGAVRLIQGVQVKPVKAPVGSPGLAPAAALSESSDVEM